MQLSEYKSGVLMQRYQYKSFEPTLMHTAWELDNPALVNLLSQADRKLGELNAFSQLIPDIDFFIKMHVFKEGTKSSKIEGTQTNIDEAVQQIEQIDPDKRDDWQEVQNYVQAMQEAIASLEILPLSNRLLRQTHATLLQGVRGRHKQPGEFRKSQNWIGGSSLNDATFIPPHHEGLDALMSDLELFLHDENDQLPHLIKIALAHYQFETIHPFLDGNGRIGRLLITLYLVDNKLLTHPTLYLSDFFEQHRLLYYDNLTRVRTNHDMLQWLKFFLEGVRVTAERAIETFKRIITLRAETEDALVALGKRQALAKKLLMYIYAKPVVTTNEASQYLGCTIATAHRLINDMTDLGVLTETTGHKRNRIFVFEAYLSLFR
jgi:Fic family protein